MSDAGSDFDSRQLGPSSADYEFGRALIEQGVSFPELHLQLARRGLSAQASERLVTELAAELVMPLVIAGAAPDKIRDRLMLRGPEK